VKFSTPPATSTDGFTSTGTSSASTPPKTALQREAARCVERNRRDGGPLHRQRLRIGRHRANRDLGQIGRRVALEDRLTGDRHRALQRQDHAVHRLTRDRDVEHRPQRLHRLTDRPLPGFEVSSLGPRPGRQNNGRVIHAVLDRRSLKRHRPQRVLARRQARERELAASNRRGSQRRARIGMLMIDKLHHQLARRPFGIDDRPCDSRHRHAHELQIDAGLLFADIHGDERRGFAVRGVQVVHGRVAVGDRVGR
jgi:hypothetical protein